MFAFSFFALIAASGPPGNPPPPAAKPAAPPVAGTPAEPAPDTVSQAPTAADVAAGTGKIFKTKRSLAALEKCLTERLSQGGEVTSVPIEGVKTLMYRTTDEPAMMIDLAPPTVKVTTKFAIGTEPIVKSCL